MDEMRALRRRRLAEKLCHARLVIDSLNELTPERIAELILHTTYEQANSIFSIQDISI
jgi:hypothetical protein